MHDHHLHQHLHADLEKRQNPNVVVQYVYKTADKTFDGPVGGYKTLNPPPSQPTPDSSSQDDSSSNSNNQPQRPQPQQQQPQQQQGNSQQQSGKQQEQQAAQQQAANDAVVQSAKEKAAADATKSAEDAAEAATAGAGNPTTKATNKQATPTTKPVHTSSLSDTSSGEVAAATTASSPSSSPSSSSDSSDSSGGGMSGGAKAGIAFGVIFAILALVALGLFLYRKKKRQDAEAYQQANDEKSAAFGGGLARSQSSVSTRTTATAPRLSLRPVTQFSPDLANKARSAQGPGNAMAAAAVPAQSARENPFGDHAAAKPARPISEKLPIQQNAPENPFGNHAEAPAPSHAAPSLPHMETPAPLNVRTPSPEGPSAAGAAGAAAAAGVGAAALAAGKKNGREDRPKEVALEPPSRPITPSAQSPALSEFSQQSGSPNGPPPTNVHRVQLDFKPSMDDELELKAGALVRLLHEYDDGWALCIRLDRSQQGVAPRTCLSARPVKPRPPPGQARGPGPRPGPNGPPRPASPGMRGQGPMRPASPAGGRGSPGPAGRQRPMGPPNGPPRSMSPGPYGGGPPRSMSPGPYGGGPQNPRGQNGSKRRSNSLGDVQNRRNSPPGPSPMNPLMQRVPMKEQAIAQPDRPSSPAVGRKPVPGQAM